MAKEGLGETIGVNCESNAKPLLLLTQVFKPHCDVDVRMLLQESGTLLRHVFYSFLVIEEYTVLINLITESRLSINHVNTVNPEYQIAVVSGALDAWKDAIINGMLDCGDRELRVFTKQFLDYFKKEGFSQLFAKYRERKHTDGTLLLELKT